MFILRLVGWVIILFGVGMFFQGMNVPAFVATSYFMFGAICAVFGGGMIYLFRNKEKAIMKEAKRQAEVEKQKNKLMNDD